MEKDYENIYYCNSSLCFKYKINDVNNGLCMLYRCVKSFYITSPIYFLSKYFI